MYGSSSRRRVAPEDDEDLHSLLRSTDRVVKRLSQNLGGLKGFKWAYGSYRALTKIIVVQELYTIPHFFRVRLLRKEGELPK